MRLSLIAPAILGMFVSTIAGSVSASSTRGTLTVNGKQMALTTGHATMKKNPFDDQKTDVFLIFTDKEIPAASVFDEFALMKLPDQGISGVTIQINDQNSAVSGTFFSPAFKKMKQFSSTGSQQVAISSLTGTSVAGSITVPANEFFGETYAYDVTFDLPIATKAADAPLPGKPLPAGGGEQGKVYEAYRKAIAAGNIPALRKLVTEEMARQTDSEDFKEMFPFIQQMQPKKIRITGGAADGDHATLLVTSLDEPNTTGKVTLTREGGDWKVVKESWKTTN